MWLLFTSPPNQKGSSKKVNSFSQNSCSGMNCSNPNQTILSCAIMYLRGSGSGLSLRTHCASHSLFWSFTHRIHGIPSLVMFKSFRYWLLGIPCINFGGGLKGSLFFTSTASHKSFTNIHRSGFLISLTLCSFRINVTSNSPAFPISSTFKCTVNLPAFSFCSCEIVKFSAKTQ